MPSPHTPRRDFIKKATAAALAGVVSKASLAQSDKPASRPPNVLFFMSDDMRVELGCYNSRFGALTPNLDKLASQGVRFDRNYCQFPLCNPSRASLLTGRTPLDTEVLGNRTDFRAVHPELTSLPQLFRQHGYVTARTGKIFHGGIDDQQAWTVGGGNHTIESLPNNLGHVKTVPRGPVPPQPPDVLGTLPLDNQQAANSDRILVLDGYGEGHPENQVAETAIQYLRTYRDQPFFIGCGFSKPHSPPTAPELFFHKYDADSISLTEDFAPWPSVPPGFPRASIRMRNADLFIGRGASEVEAREVIRAYLASISWVDWNIGRVLAELDALNLRQNTIVVFVADHGYQLGEKGKWSKAGSLFEMGTRVPLIIYDPRAKGNGHASLRIVQSLDIYPTLVELCGLPKPEGIQGSSLVPLIQSPHASWDKPAFSLWSEDGKSIHGLMVRDERWRYVEYGASGENGALLFDTHKDTLEVHNLADEPSHKHVRSRLSKAVEQYRTVRS
ncbi:sulfatase [Silvibacterium sp.]|uniref:sulfatase n=1 Tax=Silvibacterium sp. TaxID=1964179 RepID=UPI0039E57568